MGVFLLTIAVCLVATLATSAVKARPASAHRFTPHFLASQASLRSQALRGKPTWKGSHSPHAVHRLVRKTRPLSPPSFRVRYPATNSKKETKARANKRDGPTGHRVYPLGGSLKATASWYMPINLGTPGQFVNLLIDSGSTDLVVFGKSCSGCPKTNNSYSLGSSSTGGTVSCEDVNYACSNQCQFSDTCQFQDDYGGGGSIQGNVVQDVVSFGQGWNQSNIYFGQIEGDNVPGDFVNPPEDGIIGFAFSGLSAWQSPCAFDYFENVYNSFSVCLTPNNPVIELGTNYRATQKAAYNWTTIYDNPGWFNVWLSDAGVNGKSLGISADRLNGGYGVIVDTGTTFIIVDTEMMNAYNASLQAMCAKGINLVGLCNVTTNNILDGYCFNMTQQQVDMYPSLYFTLWNNDDHTQPFTLTIGPRQILQQVCGDSSYAFGLQAQPGLGLIILGDTLISSYHVVFDKYEMVMGWASTQTCPKPTA